MARRTKNELEKMESLVRLYLDDTNNDPHIAWDEYVKYNMISNNKFPDYIKGIKDFIKVSEKYHAEFEYKKRLEVKKQENKKLEKNYEEIIKNLNKENDYPRIREAYYNPDNKNYKLPLCELMIYTKLDQEERKGWKFSANDIRVYKDLNII